MRFSVILPLHNVAPWLSDCLASLYAQSYPSWEGLCVDDGSTDETEALLSRALRKESRLRVIFQPASGPSRARNRALNCASGDAVGFLDGDDAVAPWWLEESKRLFDATDADSLRFATPIRRTPPIAFDLPKPDYRLLRGGTVIHSWGWPHFLHTSYCFLSVIRASTACHARFPEAVTLKEDALYGFALLPHLQTVCLSPSVPTFYRARGNSLVSSPQPIAYPLAILATLQTHPFPETPLARRTLATFAFYAVVDWLCHPQKPTPRERIDIRTAWLQTLHCLSLHPVRDLPPHWVFAAPLFVFFGWCWPVILHARLLRLYGALRGRICHA